MGWGDEIIATGQARKAQEQFPGSMVQIVDGRGAPRYHAMWQNNPRILSPTMVTGARIVRVQSGPGSRPYIASKERDRWHWREWKCPRGEIYFSDEERRFGERFSVDVLIEPHLKPSASPNKRWNKWQRLVDMLCARGREVVQVGPSGTPVLRGARFIQTPDFRHGCAVLARARSAILPEGGLHHAAAALGIRSVVIYGAYISPKQTGYSLHENIFVGEKPCGMRVYCLHCEHAMRKITVETVLERLERLDVPASRDLAT